MTPLPDRLRALGGSARASPRGIRRFLQATIFSIAALAATTAAVAFLEGPPAGIADASPLYLVAVVAAGIAYGTPAAVAVALASFVVYDFLFTAPRYTFVVANPREWLDLVVLFFVAVVIGQLTARESRRAREATGRAREAEALFAIGHTLATSPTLAEAAHKILARLAGEGRLERVWIGLQAGTGEHVIADTQPGQPVPVAASFSSLSRPPGDHPAHWIAVHSGRPGVRPAIAPEIGAWGVPLEAEGARLGTLWGLRRRALGRPDHQETRLLSVAADQLALALRREQLSREATEAEIARQSDAQKTALLDSVSHDLRTPLASIRATAGSLIDPAVAWSDEERRSAARAIDAEAERLSELVQNVLDLSRIQGGALHPDLEVLDPVELIEPVVNRMEALRDGHPIQLDLGELPPVRADAVFLDTVLANLLENALRHAGPGAPIRIVGFVRDGWVELTVEDGGVGVPDETLPRLFGKFYRVPGRASGSRPGLGIGLSIVHGFVNAMGGEVEADRSELGGLRVRVRLPIAPEPPLG